MTQTIALLFGGRSSEHGISCVTAGGILSAIDRDRYDVVAVGITRDGKMVLTSDDPAAWTIMNGTAPEVPDDGPEVLLPYGVSAAGNRPILRVVRDGRVEDLAPIDAVLPLLHGPYGEDGTLQGALEMLDVPYVGSGVLASAQGMDKISTKATLAAAGLEVAQGVHTHRDRWERDRAALLATVRETLPAPWFVKPSRAGSSMGVTRVTEADAVEDAVLAAFAHDPRILIEAGVAGREVECGVLQGREGAPPRTTIPGEVRLGEDLEFYDYGSKYFGQGTVHIDVPAQLTDQQAEQVRAVAARAFTALGLEGLGRIDVFVTDDDRVIVNEVNTMPGFTPYSMFPVLWENMGMSYRDLITELIELAVSRPHGLR